MTRIELNVRDSLAVDLNLRCENIKEIRGCLSMELPDEIHTYHSLFRQYVPRDSFNESRGNFFMRLLLQLPFLSIETLHHSTWVYTLDF